jgi:hypothetical protein
MSSPTYTDNQVPIGSRVETLKSGGGSGSTIGVYVFENITLDRPSQIVERKDEIGQDNGWALVKNVACTGSGVCQIATAATQRPAPGMWFSDSFDGSTAASSAAEQWVITSVGQPFAHDGYFKANVNLRLSRVPPTA